MAGKIIADTLEHSTAGSIATNYVVEGSAKAWVHWNGENTASIRDSFNFASLSDTGTGDYTFSYVTNQTDGTYSSVVSASRTSNAQGLIVSSTTFNTGDIDSIGINDGGAAEDTENGCLIVHGDLA